MFYFVSVQEIIILRFPISILIYVGYNLGSPSILLPRLPGALYFPQRTVDFLWLTGRYSDFEEERKIKIPKY